MKSFAPKPWVVPMPVLIIGTYNEDGTPNAMNAAWSGQWDMKEIMISMGSHVTTKNLDRNGEFTVAFATKNTMVASDFVGIVSAKNDPKKMDKTGWNIEKATMVDAPVFTDFPMTLECRIKEKYDESETGYYLVAEIVNILVDEKYLAEDGNPDMQKMELIVLDPIHHGYIQLGDKVGNAFSDGKALKNNMETERILLRRWQESDAEVLFKYASDPDVGPRAGWPAHKSVEESREIIQTFFHNETTWAIVLKETGEAIGCIGYYTHETSNIPIGKNDCEVGYWVGKPYWNKGICTEALKLMLDYCINEKHFENIWADHFTGNPASGRVMEKCGFIDTGMLNKCSQLVGGDKDMVKVFKYKGLKKMRKKSRAMDSEWALEIMHKAPYITVSFIDEDGKPYGLPLSLASDDDVN